MSEGQKVHQVIGICPECHQAVLETEAHSYCLGGGDPKRGIKPRQQVKHLNCTGGSRYVAFSLGEDVS